MQNRHQKEDPHPFLLFPPHHQDSRNPFRNTNMWAAHRIRRCESISGGVVEQYLLSSQTFGNPTTTASSKNEFVSTLSFTSPLTKLTPPAEDNINKQSSPLKCPSPSSKWQNSHLRPGIILKATINRHKKT